MNTNDFTLITLFTHLFTRATTDGAMSYLLWVKRVKSNSYKVLSEKKEYMKDNVL